MAEIIGRQIEVGLGVEGTRGTPQSTAEAWLKKISATIIEKSEKKVDESTQNVLADSCGTRIVKKWVEGDIEGNVYVNPVGYFFYNLYGAVSSTNVLGSVYSHDFTLQTSIQHPSLSIFAKDGANSQDVFDTGMISSFELSASVDDYVKFKSSFMAGSATANSDTPSYDTACSSFVGRDIEVRGSNTEAGLASETPIKIKDLTITWDTGLISDHVLGSYSPDDIYNAKMSIEGDFSGNYVDDNFKDLMLGNTYTYIEIKITGPVSLDGTNYPTLTILLNRVAITDWSRDDSADDLVQQSVSFKAFYNESDAQQSKVTLQNTVSEYDTPLV